MTYKYADAVVILDVFKKKSERTPRKVLEVCKFFENETLRCSEPDMKKAKINKLEKAGWKVGTTTDFLGLSPEEVAFIELKLALSRDLRRRRQSKNMTQAELARLLRSSQSRVAKMEAGDPTVSFDLLMRSLFSLGASPRQLAKIFATLSIS